MRMSRIKPPMLIYMFENLPRSIRVAVSLLMCQVMSRTIKRIRIRVPTPMYMIFLQCPIGPGVPHPRLP